MMSARVVTCLTDDQRWANILGTDKNPCQCIITRWPNSWQRFSQQLALECYEAVVLHGESLNRKVLLVCPEGLAAQGQ